MKKLSRKLLCLLLTCTFAAPSSAIERNVSGQYLEMMVVDRSTGGPKTGDAANLTCYVSKDHGTLTALGDTSATEVSSTNAPGVYRFDLTQAETDAKQLLFTGKSSTSNVDVIRWITPTVPPNFALASIDSNGRVDVGKNLGSAITASGGRQEVNITHFGGTAGAFSGGRPQVNVSHFGGVAGAFGSGRPEVKLMDGAHGGGSTTIELAPAQAGVGNNPGDMMMLLTAAKQSHATIPLGWPSAFHLNFSNTIDGIDGDFVWVPDVHEYAKNASPWTSSGSFPWIREPGYVAGLGSGVGWVGLVRGDRMVLVINDGGDNVFSSETWSWKWNGATFTNLQYTGHEPNYAGDFDSSAHPVTSQVFSAFAFPRAEIDIQLGTIGNSASDAANNAADAAANAATAATNAETAADAAGNARTEATAAKVAAQGVDSKLGTPAGDSIAEDIANIEAGGGSLLNSVDNCELAEKRVIDLSDRLDGTTAATRPIRARVGDVLPWWINTKPICGGRWIASVTSATSDNEDECTVPHKGVNRELIVLWIDTTNAVAGEEYEIDFVFTPAGGQAMPGKVKVQIKND
jgi:hypothetical protein